MARVLLQAGHSAEFAPFLGGGGGAPGEADWTARLARAIEERLLDLDVDVAVVGSWMVNGITQLPPADATKAADLALFIHYDAAIYGVGGGFCDRYRPEKFGRAANPNAAVEDAFIAHFDQIYWPMTGIPLKLQRANVNTQDYYGYRGTHASTPGVLIEFGVGAPGVGQDSAVLWGKLDQVASLTAVAIVGSLRDRELLPPEVPSVPTVDPNASDLLQIPVPSVAEAMRALQQFGYYMEPTFAITELAVLAYRLGPDATWRGPTTGDEYPYTYPDGRVTQRRDFTGGIAEWNPATNKASWVEVVKEWRA